MMVAQSMALGTSRFAFSTSRATQPSRVFAPSRPQRFARSTAVVRAKSDPRLDPVRTYCCYVVCLPHMLYHLNLMLNIHSSGIFEERTSEETERRCAHVRAMLPCWCSSRTHPPAHEIWRSSCDRCCYRLLCVFRVTSPWIHRKFAVSL